MLPSEQAPDTPRSVVHRVCSLWVHSSAFSRDEVLFNAALLPRDSVPDGRLLKIRPHQPQPSRSSGPSPSFEPFVFIARDLSDEQRSKYPNLQISVSEAIASCHGFQNRMPVLLEAAEQDQHAASHVELNFKDPLTRDDLWKVIVSELHRKQCLYEGQKLLYLGAVEFSVRKIYVHGQKAASAVFTEQSKPIFRSLAARFVLGVQVSHEMWDFDHDGSCEIRWVKAKAFLAELFDRWNSLNAKHSVSLFLFTRLAYPGDAHTKPRAEDFYRVVASELASSRCTDMLKDLDCEFRRFLRDVEFRRVSSVTGLPIVEGEPVSASQGNFLEAVNLAASASLHDDIDLDFVRTGTLVLMLTPGPAIFEVSESLLRMTSARLIARQIGVELVSTAAPPLHVAPLFVLKGDGEALSNTSGKNGMPSPKSTCVIPSWVETSFYSGPKKVVSGSMTGPLGFNGVPSQPSPINRQIRVPDTVLAGASHLHGLLGGSHIIQTTEAKSNDIAPSVVDRMNVHDETVFDFAQQAGTEAANDQIPSRHLKNTSRLSHGGPAHGERPALTMHQSSRQSTDYAADRPRKVASRSVSMMSAGSLKAAGEIRIPSIRGGALLGKAAATTSATAQSAVSSKSGAASSTADENGGYYTDQVRATLTRQSLVSSSRAGEDLQKRSDINESTLRSIDESPINAIALSNSFDGRKTEQWSRNFFGGAPTSTRRMKPATRPASEQVKRVSRQVAEDLPWLVIRSPFKPRKSSRKTFGEWNHVFTRQKQAYGLKWKALCTPASLPLTTEDFPSSAQLRAGYTESPYRLAVAEDNANAAGLASKREHLARELIQSRIADGFQIAVGRRAQEITGSENFDLYAADLMAQEGAAVLLIKGDDVQLLCATGGEVAVTRFQRRSHAPTPILYQALIRTALETNYSQRSLAYSVASDTNWNIVDNDIASHEGDGEDKAAPDQVPVNHRRARFVLLPVSPSQTMSAAGSGNEDSDEEIRIEGIRKLTMLWQKHRWFRPSQQRHKASWVGHIDMNPLAIEYHTRDPSAVVAAGLESLADGDGGLVTTQLFNESAMYRTSHVDLQKLAAELQGERGIRVKPRRWHLRVYEYCFVGTDLVTFLLARFQDIKDREEAVDFGNILLKKHLFYHVHGKHAFRDGQYFYSVASEYRSVRQESKGSGWFGGRKDKNSMPSTPLPEKTTDTMGKTYFAGRKSQVCLNASLQYNLDPRKTSSRAEIITVHYDRLHNPENAFHFEVEWSNATARLVEDALTFWATSIAKFGLKLVQLPVAEASLISQINPLRAPYVIELALRPPLTSGQGHGESPRLPPHYSGGALPFMKAVLRRFGFVLDFEAASSFPADVTVTYTWSTRAYQHAQYIHRSGVILAQIVDDSKILLLANRFYNNRVARARDHGFGGKEKTGDNKHEPSERRLFAAASLPRPASALFSQGSPAASPILRPLGTAPRPSPSLDVAAATAAGKAITAEGLKDKIEAFCHDAQALKHVYEEVITQIWTAIEKPTPALSAVSTQETPLLAPSIPSLDIAEVEDEDGDVSLSGRI